VALESPQGSRGRIRGKLLKTPWGALRGEIALKGLPLPPRGSPRDIYLQKLVVHEHEQQFDMNLSLIHAMIASTASGEGSGKLFTELQNSVTGLINKLFPYNAKKPLTADKTADDVRMLKRFMNANNYTIKQKEK